MALLLRTISAVCPVINPAWSTVNSATVNWVDQTEVIIVDNLFTLNDDAACPSGLDQCTVLDNLCKLDDTWGNTNAHTIHPNNSLSLKVG